MFTGIIETMATLVEKRVVNTNIDFYFHSPITNELKVDQSVAHNGVCLTVVEITHSVYRVTAVEETLLKTNLKHLKVGEKVNIERCMPAHGRFDGHIVQGHVDDVAVCAKIEDKKGSWNFYFKINSKHQNLLVNKGSVCINGVSLTVVNAMEDWFSVTIIPYTFEHTVFHQFKEGEEVNIEFDIIGKYINKINAKPEGLKGIVV
jgi:riboflavin synthase